MRHLDKAPVHRAHIPLGYRFDGICRASAGLRIRRHLIDSRGKSIGIDTKLGKRWNLDPGQKIINPLHKATRGSGVIIGSGQPAGPSDLRKAVISAVQGKVEAGLHQHGVRKTVGNMEHGADGATHTVNERDASVVERYARLSGSKRHLGPGLDMQVSSMIRAIESDLGGVDILVNNAAVIKRVPMHEMDAADFRKIIDTDLTSAFIVSKAVLPHMMEQRSGKIINLCSMMSEFGRETVSAYASAKGGIKMLTRSIASEYGQYNIQCNGIGPGYIATAQTAPLIERLPDGSRNPFDQFIMSKTPADRWGTPEDLMGPTLFLASSASDFVNGHILYIDGGIVAYLGRQPK